MVESSNCRSHTARNPLRRSTIPGNTSTNRSTSAVGRRPARPRRAAIGRRRRPSLRAPATVRASPTSTPSPSAPPRRVGRARAGSARLRRRRRRGTSRLGSDPSPKRSTPGTRSTTVAARSIERPLRGRLGREVDGRARRAEADPRGHVLDPAAARPFLRAADEQRRDAQPAPHEQRPRAQRTTELVRGHRAEVGAERARSRPRRDPRPRTRRRARARRARATPRTPRPTGCTVPTSWFASCTLTNVVSARTASTTARRRRTVRAGRRRRRSRRPRRARPRRARTSARPRSSPRARPRAPARRPPRCSPLPCPTT